MLDGSSLKETMDALGHVREETTLRHYLRAVPEHQREAAERTAAYLLSADPSLAIASLPPAPAGLDADGDAGDMAALALLLGQVSTLMDTFFTNKMPKISSRTFLTPLCLNLLIIT